MANEGNRACLEYHIHRCTAPCINAISREEYGQRIDQAALLLDGKTEQLAGQLEADMDEAAENLDFERAASLRDQLAAVKRVGERRLVTVMGGHDQDVVGLARVEDEACVELIAIREGKNARPSPGSRLQGVAGQDDAEVLRAFLVQFYVQSTELPEELLLACRSRRDIEALAALLTTQRGRKVTVTVPKRGDKVALVEVAETNARQSADLRRQKMLSDNQKAAQSLAELQAALGLPTLPIRIECYDISNIQGTSHGPVPMVVFEQGKPNTAAYRRFRIKTVTGSRRLRQYGGNAAPPGSSGGEQSEKENGVAGRNRTKTLLRSLPSTPGGMITLLRRTQTIWTSRPSAYHSRPSRTTQRTKLS